MTAFLVTSIFGLIISIIGIINMTGNISTLHWYHRKRVSKNDKKPMGKLVGIGTLLIGLSMIIFGVLFLIYKKTKLEIFILIGIILLVFGLIVGLIFNFYAIIKYNKGLF